MSPDEQRARLEALRETPGIGQPTSIAGGSPPTEVSLEDLEELILLEQLLGYR